MNRLILLGNGFDLAHGLKTSYNDFILWYLKNCFRIAFEKFHYSDKLIEINRDRYVPSAYDNVEKLTYQIEQCYKEDKIIEVVENRFFIPPPNTYGQKNPYTIKIKSDLLRGLLQNCSMTKWVEIENEFYYLLKHILSQKKDYLKPGLLEELNDSMRCIIDHLEIYLKKLPRPNYNEAYMDILTSNIRKEDIHRIKVSHEEEPSNTLILNFNYTSTITQYLEYFNKRSKKTEPMVNFIHGKLSSKNNRLVFGFGDELDETYLLMEKEKSKGYFEFVKSFWYFKTSNYRNLVSFIEAEPYQVYILGHSCGLSDRTMLHMIFEQENCCSIKIYYYEASDGNNNFTALTHEIARHFKNKTEMRNRIVSFDRSSPMPQHS